MTVPWALHVPTGGGCVVHLDGEAEEDDLPPVPKVALLCSRDAPGPALLAALDLAAALRDARVHVESPFATLPERACLDILLRGDAPVVRVVAGLVARPSQLAPADVLARPRTRPHTVSAFPDVTHRPTPELADRRNVWLVDHCPVAVVPYAAPGGGTDRAARHALATGKPLFVPDLPCNAPLLAAGAHAISPATPVDLTLLITALLTATGWSHLLDR